MQVKNIDVTGGVAFDGTHHVGEVLMTLEGRRSKVEMRLACRSERGGADCPSTLVLYDLMTDALEQAKRTPGSGSRTGLRSISRLPKCEWLDLSGGDCPPTCAQPARMLRSPPR